MLRFFLGNMLRFFFEKVQHPDQEHSRAIDFVGLKNVDNQNIKTFPYETSSCNPVTLRQHKLSIPADVASSEKPAGPTNRHRAVCGGLAFLIVSA